MPDLTGELLTATGYLQWLPKKKVCPPEKHRVDAAGFSGCRNPARLSGFIDGGTKCSSVTEKSLGNAVPFFFFFLKKGNISLFLTHPPF